MTAPPRLPARLLERLLPPHLADAVLGDLAELFQHEAADAPRRARLTYWRRAAESAWHLGGRQRPRHAATSAGDPIMTIALRDLWHGLRLFTTQPTYAWAAAVTLALAIGANTLIFTMANVLVLKPLPVADPDRLGWILTSGPNAPQDRAGLSLPEFAAFRDAVPAFAALGARRNTSAILRDGDRAERVDRHVVIGDLQGVWGLRAVRGRVLSDADERPGAPPVAVLSHQFWQRRFGGADDAVGRTLFLDGRPRTVVGVLGPETELGNLSEIELWTPSQDDPAAASRTERGWRPTGRLAPGATVADAHAQVAAVAAQLAAQFPDTSRDFTSRVGTTRDALTAGGNVVVVLSLLALVVALLLVLACANVMNLLIARLIGRQRELAVRTALGATRRRVVRQIVAESLAIGLAGGALALALAMAGLRAVRAMSAEPFFQQLAVDGRVVAFAALLAFVAPLLFSIVPTLRLLRSDVRGALADASTRAVGSRATNRGRATLVVVQVALAVTLLVVATLVVKSVRAVVAADLGYETAGLLSVDIDVAPWMRADEASALRLRQQLIERTRAVAGVETVAMASAVPGLTFARTTPFDVVGRPATPLDRPAAGLVVATAGYFGTTRIPLAAGRGFDAADAASAEAVAVVSVETARRYWGDAASALGARLRLDGRDGEPPLEARIIGVARDTANADLDQAPTPQVVVLDEHRPTRRHYLLVRTAAPASVATAVRDALRQVDADLAVADIRTVEAAFADENSSNAIIGAMFAAFAVVAMLLATTGLYGVLAFLVSQRTPEIAVRMALGASRGDVARDVVGRAARLAALGIVVGLGGGLALAQAMAAILYGVSPTDPLVYAGVGGLTLTAAFVAAWIPTWRALAIDPIESLRQA
jgi:putative ABC transport system permease protein